MQFVSLDINCCSDKIVSIIDVPNGTVLAPFISILCY